MRVLILFILVLVTLVEVGPIPILGLFLIWVVLSRPLWFYQLICQLYNKKPH